MRRSVKEAAKGVRNAVSMVPVKRLPERAKSVRLTKARGIRGPVRFVRDRSRCCRLAIFTRQVGTGPCVDG